MALSEREQKLLEQMEQALYAEDPRFADRIRSQQTGRSSRRLVLGVLGVLAGLGLVFLGVLNQVIWLGAVGFAVMVAAGVFGFTPTKHTGPTSVVPHEQQPAPQSGKAAGGSGFMQRMEERWDRREHGED